MRYSERIEEIYHEQSKIVLFKIPIKEGRQYLYYKSKRRGKGISKVIRIPMSKYNNLLKTLISINTLTI